MRLYPACQDATGQFPDEANVKVLPSPVIIEQCNLISAPPLCNYRCVVSGRVVARSPQPDGTCKNPIYEQVPRSGR